MTVNVFAVPVFFVVFRETLETAVIVSVLLAFLKQTLGGPDRDRATYIKLIKQVISLPNLLATILLKSRSGMAPQLVLSYASSSAAV
jgi:high-affinity Fe2+/Pb2+ permease